MHLRRSRQRETRLGANDSVGGLGASSGSEPNGHRSRIALSRTIQDNVSPTSSPGTRRGGFEERWTARRNRRRAPLSPELWHCTAYPGLHIDLAPEATWAQPLSREELS